MDVVKLFKHRKIQAYENLREGHQLGEISVAIEPGT